ncbi:MAG: GTP cyclohydrolase II [Deltaproteobacteria bacterium]|nr:GTP cyclohydrolase II [Deltaproteobacteria bacterium]
MAVVRYAESAIPTARGRLKFLVYRAAAPGMSLASSASASSEFASSPAPSPALESVLEHVAIVVGDPAATPDRVLTRIHSECLTSEVFGSLKCDCKEQLDAALDQIAAEGHGVLIYLRQEGRGIGLGNKIRAYALQERGADTVDANHQLGFGSDDRSYDVAAAILCDLGIRGVRLLTNNPEKVQGLATSGIRVVERLPVQIAANLHSASYLRVKRDRMGHLLESDTDFDADRTSRLVGLAGEARELSK